MRYEACGCFIIENPGVPGKDNFRSGEGECRTEGETADHTHLERFPDGNRFCGAHFLTAETGDAAPFFKYGFSFFNTDDAGWTAFRTFSAADADIFFQQRVGFQQL